MSGGPCYQLRDLPERLERWVHYLGWSPPALEAASGVNRAVIWKWRVGRSSPTIDGVDKVVKALAVPLNEFFDETPRERLGRQLERAVGLADAQGPRLADVSGLVAGDFVAAMNQLPVSALPEEARNTEVASYLSGAGLDLLVECEIIGWERFPKLGSDERRPVTVALHLSDLEMSLRRWRFPEQEQKLVEAAWKEIEKR